MAVHCTRWPKQFQAKRFGPYDIKSYRTFGIENAPACPHSNWATFRLLGPWAACYCNSTDRRGEWLVIQALVHYNCCIIAKLIYMIHVPTTYTIFCYFHFYLWTYPSSEVARGSFPFWKQSYQNVHVVVVITCFDMFFVFNRKLMSWHLQFDNALTGI